MARPSRGVTSSSGSVEMRSRSSGPGASMPSTVADCSPLVRCVGSAAQRRTSVGTLAPGRCRRRDPRQPDVLARRPGVDPVRTGAGQRARRGRVGGEAGDRGRVQDAQGRVRELGEEGAVGGAQREPDGPRLERLDPADVALVALGAARRAVRGPRGRVNGSSLAEGAGADASGVRLGPDGGPVTIGPASHARELSASARQRTTARRVPPRITRRSCPGSRRSRGSPVG